MKRSVPLALLILLAVLGCSFGSLVGQAPTPTPTPTRTLRPTFTPIPTDTPTPLLTPTPTNTRVVPSPTPTPTFTPTFTPAPPTPTSPPPTATPVPPTPTITPTFTPTPIPHEFLYEQGSMQQAPNCGTIYIEGLVIGQGGTPASNIRVRLRWFDNVDHYVSKGDGSWGFAPYGNYIQNPHLFHTAVIFYVDVVDNDGNPRSDTHEIHFEDCDVYGQFTNIKFVYQY
mgnify:CR=1 FL=1